MRSFDRDLHRHRFLSEMTDAELEKHIDALRAERKRLADLLDHDRGLLWRGHGGDMDGPLGKLRPRLVNTKAKRKECRERLAAAESELALRRSRRRIDWDEPTETDLERLRNKLRAS
jgi:hypothetical protein